MTTLALNPKTLGGNRFLSEEMATTNRLIDESFGRVQQERLEEKPEPSVIENILNQIHKSPSFNKIVDGVSLSSISALTLSAFVNKHFFKVPDNLSTNCKIAISTKDRNSGMQQQSSNGSLCALPSSSLQPVCCLDLK